MKAKGKKVSINPVRPGKGNFVVKTEKKTVVSLIGLARPFPTLKALDMDKVCADVNDTQHCLGDIKRGVEEKHRI